MIVWVRPVSTVFPYTTLFRSIWRSAREDWVSVSVAELLAGAGSSTAERPGVLFPADPVLADGVVGDTPSVTEPPAGMVIPPWELLSLAEASHPAVPAVPSAVQ